ncbi:regulatory protein RecX [Teredinibacter turnerae]|uniref:regulatory protein RecX n=1 Tax=Teredinibacter turnerae TaxID=2426 RepID=UPI0005F8755B|nr:regulatory protein RecX [Teredinibacter turnerae]
MNLETSASSELVAYAYNSALGLLARREHSVKELRAKLKTKLASKNSSDTTAVSLALDSVEEKLVEDGYLSDERFAEVYARARIRKGFGSERLRMELKEKGIEPGLAEDVLERYTDAISTEILNTWRKKFGRPPADFKEKGKQQQFLRYRGYRAEEIEYLFDSLVAQDYDDL